MAFSACRSGFASFSPLRLRLVGEETRLATPILYCVPVKDFECAKTLCSPPTQAIIDRNLDTQPRPRYTIIYGEVTKLIYNVQVLLCKIDL